MMRDLLYWGGVALVGIAIIVVIMALFLTGVLP